jgi:hypothetical protein
MASIAQSHNRSMMQYWLILLSVLCVNGIVYAQGPIVKLDLNQAGRPESEVNESGFIPWPITEQASHTKTEQGVTFTFSKSGSVGTALKSDWYKAGVQAPNYARLVSDGLIVAEGNNGGSVTLQITGLSGTNTLLTWHNATNGYDWAQINITVNGKTTTTTPTNRAISTNEAAYSYISTTVQNNLTN